MFVMVRLELRSDLTRELRLVIFLSAKANRTGCYGPVHQAAHHCDYRRRVNPPAEKSSQRHLTHKAHPSRIAELLANDLEPLRLRAILYPGKRELPIFLFSQACSGYHHVMRCGQLSDVLIDGLGSWNIRKRKI